MRTLALPLAAAVLLLAAGELSAQDARVPGSTAKAPCPSRTEQSAALKDPKAPGPNNPDAAMPAEKSAILPSAPGDTPSAAATVQQKDVAVASPLDCELAPGHANKPETTQK